MKKLFKQYRQRLWWGFCGLCIGIAPYIFILGERERGYVALGGEISIILLPVLVWVAGQCIRDFKAAIQPDNRS